LFGCARAISLLSVRASRAFLLYLVVSYFPESKQIDIQPLLMAPADSILPFL